MMNAHFLLIDSGAAVVMVVLFLLVLFGVGYASATGEAAHGEDDHSHESGKDGHGH